MASHSLPHLFGDLTRRAALTGAASLALPASLAGQAYRAGHPVVVTRGGRIEGRRQGGVSTFKGIRYGEPTQGRRFRPPLPVRPSRAPVPAIDYGNQSPQLSLGLAEASILAGAAIDRPSSEDCLFLNVWSPNADNRARPVMVWLHGGGFVAGSGASAFTDGSRLALHQDVVVVSVNHRLGLFGFMGFGPSVDPQFADAGNCGMLDIVLALQWVRDEIASFGGDPGNVTLFGQSGGGCKVSALLAMPAARGLFHKAIVQSGSLLKLHTVKTAVELGRHVMDAFNLKLGDAAALATVPLAQIAARLPQIARKVGWRMGPVLDGRSFLAHPFDPVASPLGHNVPLLVGATRDEATLTAGMLDPAVFHLDEAGLAARLSALYPAIPAPTLTNGLRADGRHSSPSDIYFTAASWAGIRRNALIQAERKQAQGGAPVFSYLLAWETPVEGGKWKAPHALDLPLVFDNVAAAPAMLGDDLAAQRIAKQMSTAWARFARSGDPGWPGYEPARHQTMVFDDVSTVQDDPDSAQRLLLGSGPPVNLLAPGQ